MAANQPALPVPGLPVVLIVDAGPVRSAQLRSLVEDAGCQAVSVSGGPDAIERAKATPVPDLILLSLSAAGVDGLETLRQIRQAQRGSKIVMLTSCADPRHIVRAVRGGAQDCIETGDDAAVLSLIGEHLRSGAASAAGQVAKDDLGNGSVFVAASPAMRKLRALITEVAPAEVPVLCVGESGTGKEVLARLLHKHSRRRTHNFLKVNCAALPNELLESELFGYEPGAFTGAVRAKPGKFELCDKGTILLDEIGEVPPQLQAKLLHVLQDGEFTRLGGRSRIRVDVRIVAATNIDIREALETKRLREDLYYRLNTVVIAVPALRDRKEDIPILLQHFVESHGGRKGLPPRALSSAALDFALAHSWPGNVRELENFAKRFLMLGDRALAGDGPASSLAPESKAEAVDSPQALKPFATSARRDAETAAICRALEQTSWNRKEAARLLQISYKTLLEKLRLYQITAESGQRKT